MGFIFDLSQYMLMYILGEGSPVACYIPIMIIGAIESLVARFEISGSHSLPTYIGRYMDFIMMRSQCAACAACVL